MSRPAQSRLSRPLLALALVTAPFSLLAQPVCTKPDLGALFKAYAAKEHPKKYPGNPDEKELMSASEIDDYAEMLDDRDSVPHLQTDVPLVQWMALEIGSLVDGGLLAADCKGNYIDLLRADPVEQLKPGPHLPKLGATVLETTSMSPGPGFSTEELNIIGLVRGRLKVLWNHVIHDISLPPSSLSPDGGKEEVDKVSLSADGLSIEVTGTISTYPDSDLDAKPSKVVFVYGKYCWVAEKTAYLDCKKD